MDNAVSAIATIIETIVIGVVALAALLVALLIAVSLMPADNKLRRLLAALAMPVGVMAGAGAVAMPVEFIPGIDALYDIAALILVSYSWLRFFRQARGLWPDLRRSPALGPHGGRARARGGRWSSPRAPVPGAASAWPAYIGVDDIKAATEKR